MPSLVIVGLLGLTLSLVLVGTNAFLFTPNVHKLSPDSIVHVDTPVGAIFGRRSTVSIDGNTKQLTTFKGIPYAEAPIGKLRFAKPVPKAPFTSAFNAMDVGPACLQGESGLGLNLSENCLFLNIYVPSTATLSAAKKPVMIWIHGGGFQNGAGSLYDPSRLSANSGVIVVTINYRLAQMGFLHINNTFIPGNYGLWDQHLAIQWVHDNIGAFGGDVNKVTLFGQSAGASSVMYQATYPGNKGLFQRVIAESGSTTSSSAHVNANRGREYAQEFAERLGCNCTNDDEMMQCLRMIPEDDMLSVINATAYSSVSATPSSFLSRWTAAVDGDFIVTEQSEMFSMSSITAASLQFYNSLDLIMGTNKADGMIYAQEWAVLIGKTFDQSLTVTRQQFEDVIIPFNFYLNKNYGNITEVIKSVILFEYTDWDNPEDMISRLRNLIQFQTDIEYVVPAIYALNGHNIGSSNTFMYEFAFKRTNWLVPGLASVVSDDTMANHADELQFVFDAVDINATADEMRMAAAMSTMWTNFAKTGDPNKPVDVRQYFPVTWPQYDQQTQRYLEFSHQMSPGSVKERLSARRVALWTQLIPALERADQADVSC